MTSLTPAIIPTTRLLWQPDTWKSGEVRRPTVCPPPPLRAATSGSSMAWAMLLNSVFWRLATMFRWVEMAPLGRPVVPDV
jgi:hypothetical protein